MAAEQSNSSWLLVLVLIVGLCGMVLVSPLDNVAPAHLSDHAIARHGADAQRGYDAWRAGCYTQVWRNVRLNRTLRIVVADSGETYCIYNTLSGLFGTIFRSRQTVDQCSARLAEEDGWEFVGIEEGTCP